MKRNFIHTLILGTPLFWGSGYQTITERKKWTRNGSTVEQFSCPQDGPHLEGCVRGVPVSQISQLQWPISHYPNFVGPKCQYPKSCGHQSNIPISQIWLWISQYLNLKEVIFQYPRKNDPNPNLAYRAYTSGRARGRTKISSEKWDDTSLICMLSKYVHTLPRLDVRKWDSLW